MASLLEEIEVRELARKAQRAIDAKKAAKRKYDKERHFNIAPQRRAYFKQYRLDNLEKEAARKKAYNEAHKAERDAYNHESYARKKAAAQRFAARPSRQPETLRTYRQATKDRQLKDWLAHVARRKLELQGKQ